MPRVDLAKLSLDQTKLPVILGSSGNTFRLAFSKKPPFIVFCLVRKGSGIYRYGDIWKFRPWVVSMLPKVEDLVINFIINLSIVVSLQSIHRHAGARTHTCTHTLLHTWELNRHFWEANKKSDRCLAIAVSWGPVYTFLPPTRSCPEDVFFL